MAAIDRLVGDLLETLYQAPGIGLAASQVNVHKRVIVIDPVGGQGRSARAHQSSA